MKWLLVAAFALSGCASICVTRDDSTMYPLASAVTKLAAAVEATTFEAPEDTTDGIALLAAATKDGPHLLAPFADVRVLARREGEHAFILVCTKDGRLGLFEDAGCSGKLDRHYWRDAPQSSCTFTLSAATACSTSTGHR